MSICAEYITITSAEQGFIAKFRQQTVLGTRQMKAEAADILLL